MKKISLAVLLVLTGCACSRASKKEVVLRKALSDTNAALSEAQSRAHQYQLAYEKLVRQKRHRKA